MLLKYDTVYDLADFSGKEACLKPEYFKTYYCIKCLREDWFSRLDCGLMSKENHLYKRGYYVIPCYLSAHKWICGDKIVLHKRDFCYMFGSLRESEPQDVKKEEWWIAAKFKRYW